MARHSVSGPLALACASAPALLSGCVSVDPREDLARAAAAVETRAGLAPPWSATWPAESTDAWDGATPLTPARAVELSLARHPEILARLEEIAAARADLAQSGLLPNPVLSVALGFPLENAGGVSVGVSAVQQFTALWLRPARQAAASAALDQAVLEVSHHALALAADVRSIHARLRSAERGLTLRREHLILLDRAVGTMESRIAAGEGTRLDLSRQRLERSKLQADLVALELDRQTRERELLARVGMPGSIGPLPLAHDPPAPSDQPADETEAVGLALAQRLDVAASQAAARASRARLDEASLARLESLESGVDFERDDDGALSLGPSLSLSVPLFDTGDARIASAEAHARSVMYLARAAAHRATSEARTAFLTLRAAEAMLALQRDDVMPEAQRVLDLSQNALASGQADLTTTLQAQRDFIDARTRLNELELDTALARIELERAVGGLLPTTAPELPSPAAEPATAAPGSP